MKNLCAILLGVTASGAMAQGASWQPVDSIRASAERVAREHFEQPGQQLRVHSNLDPHLQLPRCERSLEARVQNASGSALTTAIACAAPSTWTVYVVVQVSREAEVLVLNRPLMAGEIVTAGAVSLHRQEIGDLAYGFLGNPQDAIGMATRHAMPAGAVLGTADLAAPRLVKRGQPVTLVSHAGALMVRAEGKALADGAAGEYIAVENLNSRRVVRGRVHSDQEIYIDL